MFLHKRKNLRTQRRRFFLEHLEMRRLMAIDLDDSISEAAFLGAVSTSAIIRNDAINPGTDVDIFAFSVAAGQTVDFDIDTPENGLGGLGSYLRIFNNIGQQLDFNDDAAAPGESTVGYDAYLRRTFNVGGTYYVGISNWSNIGYDAISGGSDVTAGTSAVGSYQLLITALSADPDDSLLEASNLGAITTTPKTTSAAINPDVDVDMYRFTVTAGQIIDFDIDTTNNGPGGLGSYIRLFNAQGQQLDFNNDGAAPGEQTVGFDAYLRFTFQTAGTYYLGVSNLNNIAYDAVTGNGDTPGGANSIGTYDLIVREFPADVSDRMNQAPNLGAVTAVGFINDGSINPATDVDLYRFTVTTGQVVDFDIDTSINGVGGLGSYLRLFNAQGTQIAFNDDGAAPGESVLGFDAYLRYTFNSAGTYYIGVSNFNNIAYNPTNGSGDVGTGIHTTGDYRLTIRALEADNDDRLTTATNLGAINSTSKVINDSISPDTDVDLYKFTVGSGMTVDFDIDTQQNGFGGLGSYLRLFNSAGQQIAFNDDGAAAGEGAVGFDAFLRYTFAFTDTYYLGVSNLNNVTYSVINGNGDTAGGLHSVGNYQLTVTAIANDTDDTINESTFMGTVSSQPLTVNGTINPDLDVDMYRITVSAGQTVDIDIDTTANGPGGLGSYIRVFNSQGVQLAFNNDAAAPGEPLTGFDAYLRFTFGDAGSYFIGVSNNINNAYNPLTGTDDATSSLNAIGDYQLTVQAVPNVPSGQLNFTINVSSISEKNGLAVGTITRTNSNNTQPLTVNLASNDLTAATVPATVTIPAGQASVNFDILSVDDTVLDGVQIVTLFSTAQNYLSSSATLRVNDNERSFHNANKPNDVNNDGNVDPLDALLVINLLNSVGVVPIGSLESRYPNEPIYFNTNNDDLLSPIDALRIITELNRGSGEPAASGEPFEQFDAAAIMPLDWDELADNAIEAISRDTVR